MCDYLLNSGATLNNKFIELLRQQPSISELNERLDKILTSKKLETQLNETLKENIRNFISCYYDRIHENACRLGEKLNNEKKELNSCIENRSLLKFKQRSSQFKQTWYQNQIKFEQELSVKQRNELKCLENTFNERTSELVRLNECFKQKQLEIESLMSNLNELNQNCSTLAQSLFDIKHENTNLRDTIENLKQEINFYKNFNTGDVVVSSKKCLFLHNSNTSLNISIDSNLGSSLAASRSVSPKQHVVTKQHQQQQQSGQISTSSSTSDLNSIHSEVMIDDGFYKNELAEICIDIRAEYDVYMWEQLDVYEDECEAEFYKQLEEHENEFEEMSRQYDTDYEQLQAEIDELNNEYMQNLNEFIEVNDANTALSERLVSLSESIVSFSRTNSHRSELVVMKYSLNSLRRHIIESKTDCERFEVRLASMKNLLFNRNIDLILNESVLLKSINTLTTVEQLRTLLFSSGSNNTTQQQQLFEVFYTQTNVFGFVQFNFSLNHKTSSISIKQKDKCDTSVLVIENLDKVLDLDLSEWVLRREIYDAVSVTSNTEAHKQIEFRFPKGFKLKRRKKLVLLSKSANVNEYQPVVVKVAAAAAVRTPIRNKNPPPPSTATLMTNIPTKLKDVDVYYCNTISNWGCGMQMLTKLINNKNMTKYVNYRSFKSIWSNLV